MRDDRLELLRRRRKPRDLPVGQSEESLEQDKYHPEDKYCTQQQEYRTGVRRLREACTRFPEHERDLTIARSPYTSGRFLSYLPLLQCGLANLVGKGKSRVRRSDCLVGSRTPHRPLRFLLCGVGDPRNMLMLLLDLKQIIGQAPLEPGEEVQIEIHINDCSASVLARFILLSFLLEGFSGSPSSAPSSRLSFLLIVLIWSSYGIPRAANDLLRAGCYALLRHTSKLRRAKSTHQNGHDRWGEGGFWRRLVFPDESHLSHVREVWRRWLDASSEPDFPSLDKVRSCIHMEDEPLLFGADYDGLCIALSASDYRLVGAKEHWVVNPMLLPKELRDLDQPAYELAPACLPTFNLRRAADVDATVAFLRKAAGVLSFAPFRMPHQVCFRAWACNALSLRARLPLDFKFDRIDTSSISDHVGLLNLLLSIGPLLSPLPTSTLHTDSVCAAMTSMLVTGGTASDRHLDGVLALSLIFSTEVIEVLLGLTVKTSSLDVKGGCFRMVWGPLMDGALSKDQSRGLLKRMPEAFSPNVGFFAKSMAECVYSTSIEEVSPTSSLASCLVQSSPVVSQEQGSVRVKSDPTPSAHRPSDGCSDATHDHAPPTHTQCMHHQGGQAHLQSCPHHATHTNHTAQQTIHVVHSIHPTSSFLPEECSVSDCPAECVSCGVASPMTTLLSLAPCATLPGISTATVLELVAVICDKGLCVPNSDVLEDCKQVFRILMTPNGPGPSFVAQASVLFARYLTRLSPVLGKLVVPKHLKYVDKYPFVHLTMPHATVPGGPCSVLNPPIGLLLVTHDPTCQGAIKVAELISKVAGLHGNELVAFLVKDAVGCSSHVYDHMVLRHGRDVHLRIPTGPLCSPSSCFVCLLRLDDWSAITSLTRMSDALVLDQTTRAGFKIARGGSLSL